VEVADNIVREGENCQDCIEESLTEPNEDDKVNGRKQDSDNGNGYYVALENCGGFSHR